MHGSQWHQKEVFISFILRIEAFTLSHVFLCTSSVSSLHLSSSQIVHGYQSMPSILDNPQWWMLEIFDGFGVHFNNLVANRLRVQAKILSLKEEGDSSSIN
mmetsp:Transcript_11118/g.23632  ORF Transcript_11118/g.23632 Transcript_11118/m.23632 type:complete len:101 (+) Transcript_11118:1290-1592(+)